MISLYMRYVAARRAYTAARNRDARAFQAWCADHGKPDPTNTAHACTVAYHKMSQAHDAWEARMF